MRRIFVATIAMVAGCAIAQAAEAPAAIKGFTSSEEVTALIAKAKQTADTAQRYALYQRCEEILAAECPIAPIYFYTRNNLVRPEVKGWYGNLLDQHPLKGVYLEPKR